MICWWCKRPILVGMKVRNVNTDTVRIGEHVRMTEQQVKCSTCGSEYTIETYLDNRPTVTDELLAKLDNSPHP